MQRTRWQILETLKMRGPSTLDELARTIGLVAPTVRVHLSVLQRDGLVTADEVRGKVGRPHFLYSLTNEALELFPRHYDRLASGILDELRRSEGDERVAQLLCNMMERWVTENASRLNGETLQERVQALVELQRDDGAMAEWAPTDGGFIFSQFNCPSFRVAQHHPELCLAEEHFLRVALKAKLERLRCAVTDGHACSFIVREH